MEKQIETLKTVCDILLGVRNMEGDNTRDSVHQLMKLCRENPKETCEAVGLLQDFISEIDAQQKRLIEARAKHWQPTIAVMLSSLAEDCS